MKKKIKYKVLLVMAFLLTALYIPITNTLAKVIRVDIIESPDILASDTEYDVNQISDDYVIIVINCPGIFGFC